MIKRLKVVFVFLFVVVALNFFDARILTNNPALKSITLYFRFACIIGVIALSIPYTFPKRSVSGFTLPVQLLFLSAVISIFMAYYSWDQSLLKSALATVPYMLWIFFFYLLEMEIPVETIENIVLIYGGLYVVLFLYQFTHVQTPLFGGAEEFLETRGVIRIIFPGGGVLYLSSFIAINKLTSQKDKKWLWLSMAMLGLICTVMQVTRQSIAGLSLLFFYHLTKDLAAYKKIIVLIISVMGIIFFLNSSDNPIVKGMVEQQVSDVQDGKNYIRVVAANYFLNEFSPNPVSRVLGNGVPYALDSNYALFVAGLRDRGFYLSDVGIIAMYIMFGVLAVIAYVIIWIKSFTMRVPKEYYYVKYYLWYLLITCVTSNYLYDQSYSITTILALYIFQTVYEKSKEIVIQEPETLAIEHQSAP